MNQRAVRLIVILFLMVGLAELPAHARRFGGGRSGGFGGGRSYGSRPWGGFSRSRPLPAPAPPPVLRPPTGGLSQPAPSSRPGGFGGRPRTPSDGAAGSISTPAPSARPGAGTSAAPGSGPSSITAPAPTARPGASQSRAPTTEGPSSITAPPPSSRPSVPGRVGQPGPRGRVPTPAPSDTNYRRYPGGVYVPYGGSPWGYYPYFYFWWLGVPRPFGYGYGHASVLSTVVTVLVAMLLVAAVVAGIVWMMRRRRRDYSLSALEEISGRRGAG